MDLNSYGGMDLDLKDYVVEGKYALQITGVDLDYVSSGEKKSKGVEVKASIVDGPAQDEKGTSPQGMSTKFILWYPNENQKDKGFFCAKKLNGFLDACGLNEKRKASAQGGDPITEQDIIGQVIVATADIDDSGDDTRNDWKKFQPYAGGQA